MSRESSLEKFRQVTAEIARKQQRLKEELAKRSSVPQPGDVFIFDHPKTLWFQWVVLKIDPKHSQSLWVVPADNNPMAGSRDIRVPDHALSGPLTVRCGYSLTMNQDQFKQGCVRVGFLDDWDLQHALDQLEQIAAGKVRSTVLQQETDHDPDYQEWLEQVKQGQKALEQSSPAVVGAQWVSKVKNLPGLPNLAGFGAKLFWRTRQRLSLVSIRTVGWAISAVMVLVLSFYFWPSLQVSNSVINSDDDVIDAIFDSNVSDRTTILYNLFPEKPPDPSVSHFSEPSSHPSAAVQAFRAGLWKSRQELLLLSPTLTEQAWLTKDWLKTEWAIYFKLGQWVLLLETMCQLSQYQDYTVSAEFWAQQLQMFTQLKQAVLELTTSEDIRESAVANLVVIKLGEGIEQQGDIGQLLAKLSTEPHRNDYAGQLGDQLKAIRKEF